MFGTEHFPLFVLSGVLLNLTPGQDTLYIVGRRVSQGRRAGVLSVVGIVSGTIVHTIAAAFGLSAILPAGARIDACQMCRPALADENEGSSKWLS